MAEHLLKTSLTVPQPLGEVFAFFADAGNLERITPPEFGFHIVTPQPIVLKTGALIDYKMSMRGIPVKWRTEITVWNPPFEFEDRQLKGPYNQWIHRHTFTAVEPKKTLIEDEVRYRLPFEPFSDIAHFFVEKELKYIFDYREKAVEKFFGSPIKTI